MDDLTLLASTVFSFMTQIFNLYTGTWLLSGVLALWLVRKVAGLFRHIT
jgi:uncharacterized membrane protein YbhN (UPF0104 family)|nr:MAG TPA: hypothetical protein [Inoviridae sp.]